jgi:hypothetical protein
MAGGLFSSPYGRTDKGLFSALFSQDGTFSPVKSVDLRLGEADDEDDKASGPAGKKLSFFTKSIAGFPVWLLAVFALGFAYSYKKRKD